jgi:hypothetical protein
MLDSTSAATPAMTHFQRKRGPGRCPAALDGDVVLEGDVRPCTIMSPATAAALAIEPPQFDIAHV